MKWPTWMDEAGLMAKSREMGGDTLAEHTWKVLERLSDQVRLHPNLPSLLQDEQLWTRMYWACFLHDFGKAALEFQQVLQKQKNLWSEYKQRHEILSLAFVDWLFPRGHPDRAWVIAVIAFHHKDVDLIIGKYGGHQPANQMDDQAREDMEQLLDHLAVQIAPETQYHLWRWLNECGLEWATALQIPSVDPVPLVKWQVAAAGKPKPTIFRALRDFYEWNKQATASQRVTAILTRGLILTADHAASAGVTAFPDFPLDAERAHKPLAGRTLRSHQQAAADAPPGSALMIAPTGSGKTEAALLWVARQLQAQPAARLFYTLPYQASMNAMYARLATRYFDLPANALTGTTHNQVVTIQHSRALLKLYQDAMALEELSYQRAKQTAEQMRNWTTLNFYPIQIFSPYQMLKAAYSLKGYEALLVDYAQALFIFDEIHAYEPKRLALIIQLMGWLRLHFGARFLVMTATLPPLVREKVQIALGISQPEQMILASAQEFARSQRHTVHLLAGRMSEQIVQRVGADLAANRTVLVCLNRVADAQKVYDLLIEQLGLMPNQEIVLLHGRFNGRDRKRKEDLLLHAVGVTQPAEARARRFVAVATQVVEVSLDVDFDTLYTEPAPLEALLQRFGRVNRGRATQLLCPVHVLRQPFDANAKEPYRPYEADLVERSLQVLEARCGDGQPIDESLVTTMLGEIYQGAVAERWQKEYEEAAHEFQQVILDRILPFQSAEREQWTRFYEMFDGIEILPEACADDYYTAKEQDGYLAASQYLLNISKRQYAEFKSYGLIVPAKELEGEYADHILVHYDEERGLDLDGARQQAKVDRQRHSELADEDDS
jgi:CRISPR-associated endonuclease/helicase Cas3